MLLWYEKGSNFCFTYKSASKIISWIESFYKLSSTIQLLVTNNSKFITLNSSETCQLFALWNSCIMSTLKYKYLEIKYIYLEKKKVREMLLQIVRVVRLPYVCWAWNEDLYLLFPQAPQASSVLTSHHIKYDS